MNTLLTLGLWGDGDEIHAIEDAFTSVNVRLPVEDASTWVTVSDLWASVQRVAPEVAIRSDAWDRFRQALAVETAVDWTLVDGATTLLDGRGHSILQRLIFSLRERFARA